jgi:hypothetical protein
VTILWAAFNGHSLELWNSGRWSVRFSETSLNASIFNMVSSPSSSAYHGELYNRYIDPFNCAISSIVVLAGFFLCLLFTQTFYYLSSSCTLNEMLVLSLLRYSVTTYISGLYILPAVLILCVCACLWIVSGRNFLFYAEIWSDKSHNIRWHKHKDTYTNIITSNATDLTCQGQTLSYFTKQPRFIASFTNILDTLFGTLSIFYKYTNILICCKSA